MNKPAVMFFIKIAALFAWSPVRDSGVWMYEQNEITGKRRATRYNYNVWQPLDANWLKGKGHDR